MINELVASEEDAVLFLKRNSYFIQYKEYFQKEIQKKLVAFDIDFVLYDEVEYFQQYSHPLFNYPYTPRKNILTSQKFNL